MNESPDQHDAAIRRLLKESEIEETPKLFDGLRRLRALGALPATDPTGELAALLAEPGVPVRPVPLEPKSARPKSQRHRGLILSFALAAAMGAGASGVAASSDMRFAGGAPGASRGSEAQNSDAEFSDVEKSNAEVREQTAPEKAEPEQEVLPPAADEYSPTGSAGSADSVPPAAPADTAVPPAFGTGLRSPQGAAGVPPQTRPWAGRGEGWDGRTAGKGRYRADCPGRGATATYGCGADRSGFPGLAGR